MKGGQRLQTALLYASALVVIMAGLKMASQVVIILFLSIFAGSILSYAVEWMQRRGVPKVVAFLFILTIFVIFILSITILVLGSAESFIKNLPSYERRLGELLMTGNEFLSRYDIRIDPDILMEGLSVKTFVMFGGKAAGTLGTLLSKTLIVTIGVSFVLFESANFRKKLETIFSTEREFVENFDLFSLTIRKYFAIKSMTSLLTGASITATLLFFDIQYAILWGFLGFMLNFIPVIGSMIAAIPPLLLALLYKDPETFFWMLLIYIAINNLISNVLEPKIMGDGLGLSPAAVFFSLIIWGWILGPAGMFLSVPLTMTIKIALDSGDSTRWIALLMSSGVTDGTRGRREG
jgi:predicted PurR-regulated permease PerM